MGAQDDDDDKRKTLGVRPGSKPRPTLIIAPHLTYEPPQGDFSAPPSPRSPEKASHLKAPQRAGTRNVSNNSAASSSQPLKQRLRRGTLAGRKGQGLTNTKGQFETQQLLQDRIEKLENRAKVPDLLDQAAGNARRSAVRAKVKGRSRLSVAPSAPQRTDTANGAGPSFAPTEISSEDLDRLTWTIEDGQDDIDHTYELLEQVRDLLVLGEKQGMDLFGSSHLEAAEAARNKARGRRKTGRFSTSPLVQKLADNLGDDPVRSSVDSFVSGPDLLSRLQALIKQLLSVDCIHVVQRFRLYRPPYALQAMCLDIAALLYHKGTLEIKLSMMSAAIDSIYAMDEAVTERVCVWLEGRLAELLDMLADERGHLDGRQQSVDFSDPFIGSAQVSPDVPTFAFSAEPEDMDAPAKKQGWMRWSPTAPTHNTGPTPLSRRDVTGVLSTHATSGISITALQIAELVPRILVATTSTVDLTTAKLTTLYRCHRMLSLILTAKPDAAVDLLEIVAHGPSITRRRAVDLLATFFPQSMGHNVIARRPAISTYIAHQAKWETGQDRVLGEDDMTGHCYIPWRSTDPSETPCTYCNLEVDGFCVRCVECQGVKHLNCLRIKQEEMFEYDVLHMGGQQTVRSGVMVRFSKCVPRLDELVLGGGSTRNTIQATRRNVGGHRLHLVNLFTLTLCGECREPLWGASSQAYACMGSCQRFYHRNCAQVMHERGNVTCRSGHEVYINPASVDRRRDPFTTSSDDILASFQRSKAQLFHDPEQLANLSYDEVVLLFNNVWAQAQIYRNGVKAGAIRFDNDIEDALKADLVGFEKIISTYEDQLLSNRHTPSEALADFSGVTGVNLEARHDLLWQPNYLRYCAAVTRAPPDPDEAHSSFASSGGLLTVTGSPLTASPETEAPPVSYESIDMASMRESLATDLSVGDELAASILVEQMRNFGLVGIPKCLHFGVKDVQDNTLQVTFPLPLLMDSSPTVELLVLVIETLLEEIDLSANEQALSLLVNRAWPNTMCSAYALERLGGAVMSWIMAQDDVLHHIVKNYASKRKRLPGVRSTKSTTVQSYKEDRIALLHRYAYPWLKALHDQDTAHYASLAYERSKAIDNRYEVIELMKGEKGASQVAEIALERLTALGDANVLFSSSLDLLTAWLEDLGALINKAGSKVNLVADNHQDVVYKSLPRLLRHGSELSRDTSGLWELSQVTSDEGPDGFQRVARWIRVLAFSGVEVPWPIIEEMVDAVSPQTSTQAKYDLVSAINANITEAEPKRLADICNNFFNAVVAGIERRPPLPASVSPPPASETEVEIVRMGLLAILRAYHTPAEAIASTPIQPTKDAPASAHHTFQKKRRPTVSTTTRVPLQAETVLAAAGLLRRREYPAEMFLDFLWLLMVKSQGAENVDGFFYMICPNLYELIWPLYDRPVDTRSRGRLFLRLLTIHPGPMQTRVALEVSKTGRAQIRERLLTFVLGLADENITSGSTGWRAAAVELILLFFSRSLTYTNPLPDNLSIWSAFLPSQLTAISACFEEYLSTCTDEQRLNLLVRLQELQPALPTWPMIKWETIEQLLIEQTDTIRQLERADSDNSMKALRDARVTRASLLSLGLNMLSAGVACDWMSLQRFQQHLAAACALPWPADSETITGIILPALKQNLDATARIPINANQTTARQPKTILIGSLFVPVVTEFATELKKYDFLTQRYILDILLVVFFKHNVMPVELPALNALQKVAIYAADADCIDNKLLALRVLQTAQSHMATDRFSRVLPQLFVYVSDIMIREAHAQGDPLVIDLCRGFLHESLADFGRAGLFLQVLLTDGQLGDSSRSPDAIGRALRIAGGGKKASIENHQNSWLEQLLVDLPGVLRWNRAHIARLLQSLSRLSATLEDKLTEDGATEFGTFIARLGKTVAEWDNPAGFDPNPVLQTCSAILQLTPSSYSRTLLHQVSTFLHLALSRFSVSLDPIKALIPVSIDISSYHRTENTVTTVLFELAGEAISGLAVMPDTLHTLLTFLTTMSDDRAAGRANLRKELLRILVEASPGCEAILVRSHPTTNLLRGRQNAEQAMKLFNAAAQVIVRAELESPGNIGLVLRGIQTQASIVQMDVFTHVLYASLNVSLKAARENLISLYPILARAAALSLFATADLLLVNNPYDSYGVQLASSVFIVCRLATLAVHDIQDGVVVDEHTGADRALAAFWRRLWPDWERLLALSLAPTCANTALRSVGHSVLLDIVIFVGQAQPSLLIEPATLIGSGLKMLEEWYPRSQNTAPAKLGRAFSALDSAALRGDAAGGLTQPTSSPASTRRETIKQIWNDMVATERLLSMPTGDE